MKKATQEAFETFHHDNPHVYTKLVELTRQVKLSGFTVFSIKAIFERLRWYFQFDVKTSSPFKLNNNHHSGYARLIMAQEPDLAGFFKIRTQKVATA